ncbi:hypothetical protein [Paenibacillus sp. FSL P4-0081]|uniref:hypothetical protein n=1 Tax=Paenibacillus sp. FSL P4-0081 TaxID=1536769 RepID=UPI001E59D4A5|nr:hypothetical protein [Paenibacillus sp. FSL P4-0081]
MKYNSIKPGQIWLDTNGERIQAHGGSIITVDDTFYWYGENKENTDGQNDNWHWGVKCYASKDLYNWEDKGIIILPDTEDESSPLHPKQFMDRPHIIYNEKTKKVRMLAKDYEKRWNTSLYDFDGRSYFRVLYYRKKWSASA